MFAGISTNNNNFYPVVDRTQSTQKVNDAYNGAAQTLDDFKREMYCAIDKMPVHPSQFQTQISISISDKAFEKMMNDHAYKDLMIKTIQRDLGGAFSAGAAPSYSVIRIGDNCEYMSAYGQ